MTQPTIAQLHNLTDRAAHGLTADEQQRLRDGIDRLERAETAENRLRLAHQARRAKEHQLDGIRRALSDIGAIEDSDPYSHADLEDVIRQLGHPDEPHTAGTAPAHVPGPVNADDCPGCVADTLARAERAEAAIEAVAEVLADHNGDDWSRHPATQAVAAAITLRALDTRPADDTTPAQEQQ